MSLRALHIVFVVLTVILSLFVTWWGLLEFARERSAMGLVLALVFLATAVGMAYYGKRVFVKLRDLP
jgi:hypothetical protein